MDKNEMLLVLTIMELLGKPVNPERVVTVYHRQKEILEEQDKSKSGSPKREDQ